MCELVPKCTCSTKANHFNPSTTTPLSIPLQSKTFFKKIKKVSRAAHASVSQPTHVGNPTTAQTLPRPWPRPQVVPPPVTYIYSHTMEINSIHPSFSSGASPSVGFVDRSLSGFTLTSQPPPPGFAPFASSFFFAEILNIGVSQGSAWGLFPFFIYTPFLWKSICK